MFTAFSRSTHRRSCGVTMCTNTRSGPAAQRRLRGRVSGWVGMIGGNNDGDACLSWRGLVIEHPKVPPLHIMSCSSTNLAVTFPAQFCVRNRSRYLGARGQDLQPIKSTPTYHMLVLLHRSKTTLHRFRLESLRYSTLLPVRQPSSIQVCATSGQQTVMTR